MIEKTIYDYLTDELNVPVHLERPVDIPDAYVLIERTSGGKINGLNNATLAIQSYETSLLKACQLNETVKALMDDAVTLTNIFSVKLNSDYNYTNQAFKGYRYQAVFYLTYKE